MRLTAKAKRLLQMEGDLNDDYLSVIEVYALSPEFLAAQGLQLIPDETPAPGGGEEIDLWKDGAFKNGIEKNVLMEMLITVLDKIDKSPDDCRYLSVTKPARELIKKLKSREYESPSPHRTTGEFYADKEITIINTSDSPLTITLPQIGHSQVEANKLVEILGNFVTWHSSSNTLRLDKIISEANEALTNYKSKTK